MRLTQPKRSNFPTTDEIMAVLDREDARQREALRKYLHRAEPQLHVTGKSLLVFFGSVLATLAAMALFGWWIFP